MVGEEVADMSHLVSFCLPVKFGYLQSFSNARYSRYELTPSGKEQPIEKAKHLGDVEVGLPDEARHMQHHSRLHRYLRSLRSTLRRQ
jgi:hypothetical protein